MATDIIDQAPAVAPVAKKRGRPPGSKTEPRPVAELKLSRCPACGSTERSEYRAKREMSFQGLSPDGHRCDAVVWRHTTCLSCGQLRIDKSWELREAS